MVLPFLPLVWIYRVAGPEEAKNPAGRSRPPDSDPLAGASLPKIPIICQSKNVGRRPTLRCAAGCASFVFHTATTKWYEQTGVKYPTTLIIATLFWSTAAAGPEQVICDSPCDCHDAHGEGRWSVKTDASLPPTDAGAIQAVTPSEMFSWPGPDAAI